MSNYKNAVFVVTLKTAENKKLYFVRTDFDKVQCVGVELLSVPKGIFSTDLKDAKKFLDYNQALFTASYFGGADVESIKEGERLK